MRGEARSQGEVWDRGREAAEFVEYCRCVATAGIPRSPLRVSV